ncbi:hypothetical protein PILCRDRAFT_828063 [Piloderma croceum F 1598]|uniref:Uncharacterized protein n=1 Tax=Piloderma croceum (strain F 1598) TaxID=765440 RepID=A0A0C3EQ09_PILCF|nr:hypothetical protein PILCRDRAFT_828063 [Piloderma croceum F 1598]
MPSASRSVSSLLLVRNMCAGLGVSYLLLHLAGSTIIVPTDAEELLGLYIHKSHKVIISQSPARLQLEVQYRPWG